MKNFQITLILLLLAIPHLVVSQDFPKNELHYEVYTIYPPLSMNKEKLQDAKTLVDLHANYKESWIREYISVEILTRNNGKDRIAMSNNTTLTPEQKENMYMADFGSDISVNVQYIPENNLKQNDAKEINFSFIVDPESEATYPGGQQQLKRYVKEQAIDKIPEEIFQQYQLTAVKFTINEYGQVIDAHVFWTSEDEKTDELLMETICNMPSWKPAEYSNGQKVKQEFVLTVGDIESCVTNLLNIRREIPN